MEQSLRKEAGPIWAPPPRAPYATDPARSRGRLHPEPESATRTPFQRDRDRIIHAEAFRRLKQKTQVFVAHEGDNYRTRLTHSLEVAQIARSAARNLGLDEDLAETVGLAHDIGHPPFGHAGESELNTCMTPYGGFDHNAQTLRVLTKLEERFPTFDGLNLSWETLEGVVKHNGPLLKAGMTLTDLPMALQAYAAEQDLELGTWSGPEAQIAAMADDIAYNNHDIDDGWRAGLFRTEELLDVPFVADVLSAVAAEYPGLPEKRLMAETVRRLIGARIADLVSETQARAARLKPRSAEDVRKAGEGLVGFSAEMQEHEAALRRFLFDRMYRHTRVNRMMSQARRIVRELFTLFLAEPDTLPRSWFERTQGVDQHRKARIVCDYIAGMTDPFAIEEHRRLFNLDRWS